MNKMREIWKPVIGFYHYNISSLGRLRNPYGKILHPTPNYKGYLKVKLYPSDGGNPVGKFIHRLVAEAFIPNPDNLPQINHKNYNKQDNTVDNLEWCTNEYNQRYSSTLKINQYSINGKFIRVWGAISDASKALGIPTTNISKCCKGKILTINHFIFLYEKDRDISVRLEKIKNRRNCRNKQVSSFDANMCLLKTFDSVKEAAAYYKFSPKTVIECCKGIRQFNKLITFKYV